MAATSEYIVERCCQAHSRTSRRIWYLDLPYGTYRDHPPRGLPRSVESHPLAPGWDLRVETKPADLRLERVLGLRIAVHDEDRLGESSVAGALVLREVADPIEELWLVGVT